MAYNPGKRSRRFRQGFRISENRVAWWRGAWGSVAMMKYADLDEQEQVEEEGVQQDTYTEPGPTIRLIVGKNGTSRQTVMDLTMLTEEELKALRVVIEAAFDAALPVCQLRDEEASKAHAQGDDGYTRSYRTVPQLVVREGASVEHIESLRDRLKVVPVGPDGDGSDRELRAAGDGLAERQPRGDESKDDQSSTD